MSSIVMEPGERLRVLFDKGSQVEVLRNIPIRRYYRSCQELIRMAQVYYDEKDLETSYVYYAKFIILSFEKLKTHPEFSKVPATEKTANKKALKMAFDRAEKLKVCLKRKYEEAYRKYKEQQKQAAELIKQEEERKIKEEEKLKIEQETAKNKAEKEQIDAFLNERLRKELEMERLEIAEKYGEKKTTDTNEPLLPVEFAPPPSLPSTTLSINDSTTYHPVKPSFDRSLKPSLKQTNALPETAANQSSNMINQMSTAFAASLTLSKNKYGLRSILSPGELPAKFMTSAKSNTAKNIETCGVLFGKLANEVFVITHVLIPHQKGAPDSCDTTREEDMWDFQDQYDGICLGWIHTHPSQTAFLSSVDLHTHYPYQCLMPESVAIVCSGKFNEVGYFMITPHHGMNVIGNCKQLGFHPHPTNPSLFEASDHVKPSSSHTVEIIDWRNK